MAFGDFIVTRASTKNVLGFNGLYQSVANDTPAFEFNADGSYRGLLVEPGATNQIRNNSAQGATAGTPGTLPTHYSVQVPAGLTTTVTGVGTENGINYFDIRLNGTATSTTNYEIRFEASNTQIVATASQVWTHSAFLKVVSAPNPPNSYQLRIRESTSGGTFVGWILQTVTPTSNLLRYSVTGTTAATTERVAPFLLANVTNGVAYDFTIRIGWPQLETGSVATSPIVTTGSTASRSADVVSLTGASSLIGQTEGTLYAEAIPRGITSPEVRPLVEIDNGNIGNDGTVIRLIEAGNFQLVSRLSTATVSITSAGLNTNVLFKFAGAYKTDDFIAYVNGSSIGSVVSGGVFGGNTIIRIGGDTDNSAFNGWIRSIALYPTRLDNATLQALTTL